MRVAIVIDDWKLPTFESRLSMAGYAYTQGPGLTPDTVNLYIETEDMAGLTAIIKGAQQAANRAALRSRGH